MHLKVFAKCGLVSSSLNVFTRYLLVRPYHYGDVIMGPIASQITSLAIVYSTVYSGADQRKHQSPASLAFVRGIHRGPVNSPHKWPVMWKVHIALIIILTLWTNLPTCDSIMKKHISNTSSSECSVKMLMLGIWIYMARKTEYFTMKRLIVTLSAMSNCSLTSTKIELKLYLMKRHFNSFFYIWSFLLRQYCHKYGNHHNIDTSM